MYTLIIAQKAYSSWSLRGWLMLEPFGIPFEEKLVRLYQPEFDEMTADKAPARTVPILEWQQDGRTMRVWESIAIAETLAERHPEADLWPRDPANRTVARIVAAEMHAGFGTLRTLCPMNLHRVNTPRPDPTEALMSDVARAGEIWNWALAQTGGPWLGGPEFSIADAFMAPLASRLVSYGLLDDRTRDYAERLMSHPSVLRWTEDAHADPERIEFYESIPAV
ncbi:glutathione S-transferase N-terminal domain-containing protein [Rhodobacteraceae bacterium NNCM2]|nr:glutathione S-transferase N-terminal domain-containing protein [Coraliihabitans acroporae]